MVSASVNETSGFGVGGNPVALTHDNKGLVVERNEADVQRALDGMKNARSNHELKKSGLMESANFKPSAAAQKTIENGSQVAGRYAALTNRWVHSATASSAGYRRYPDYRQVLNQKNPPAPTMRPELKLALQSFKIASQYLLNLPKQKIVPLGETVMAVAARKKAENNPAPFALKNPQFNKYDVMKIGSPDNDAMRPAAMPRRVRYPELAA